MQIELEKIKEKYSFKRLLDLLNNFTNKDISSKEIDVIEREVDLYWKEHYKDFSKYYSYEYLYIGLNCFKKYSKNCVLKTYEYLNDKNIKTILDYGAGPGWTTNLLQRLFPDAQVYYFNLEDDSSESDQNIYFTKYKVEKIKVLNSLDEVKNKKFDIIFASELFEHIEKPIDILRMLMPLCSKYFITSNAFGPEAYGHFTSYDVDGEILLPRETSKKFLKEMRTEFKDMKIKTWNSRPRIFERK